MNISLQKFASCSSSGLCSEPSCSNRHFLHAEAELSGGAPRSRSFSSFSGFSVGFSAVRSGPSLAGFALTGEPGSLPFSTLRLAAGLRASSFPSSPNRRRSLTSFASSPESLFLASALMSSPLPRAAFASSPRSLLSATFPSSPRPLMPGFASSPLPLLSMGRGSSPLIRTSFRSSPLALVASARLSSLLSAALVSALRSSPFASAFFSSPALLRSAFGSGLARLASAFSSSATSAFFS
mmetsp:Transcript_71465/g.167325  ORF Transcript_71465/g.167325 Transcript_71465/m.167325 type:complete len:239 (+) Transcript_71465:1755-2471(+)